MSLPVPLCLEKWGVMTPSSYGSAAPGKGEGMGKPEREGNKGVGSRKEGEGREGMRMVGGIVQF